MFNQLKYLLCFFLPSYVVTFLATGPHTITDALLGVLPLWLLILLDFLSPKVTIQIVNQYFSKYFYDTILYALACIQFLIIILMLIYASQLPWQSTNEIISSCINLFVLRILVGSSSGSSALIVAHELIHRTKRQQQILGRLLLYTVCYEHFVIAHIRGHHYSVASPKDIATARLGESFSSYWKRVNRGHFIYAWNSERQRLNLQHIPNYHYKMLSNSVLQGLIVEALLIMLIFTVFGWAATFIFLYQAYAGVRLLETINYFQHWGLEQGKAENTLAWVNQSSITEHALIGLSRHIGHHQNAATLFYKIPYSEHGPIMPFGYFVTNLWVKLHNKSYCRFSENVLTNFYKQRME